MNAQFLFSAPSTQWDPNFAAMASDGVRAVRSDSFWNLEEPNPPVNGMHHYDWSRLDPWVAGLARHGMRWTPIVDFSVWWDRSVSGSTISPPTEVPDFGAYAGALAARYGPGGSFWAENSSLPDLPVRSWEIWNEENIPLFWAPTPNPAAYADLYAEARTKIHDVDANAIVAVGGLTPDNLEGMLGVWLTQRPDSAHHLDAVAFHPYGATPDVSLHQVQRLRTDLSAMGNPDTPIMITEIGWTTSGSPYAVSDSVRASYLTQVTDALLRSDCGVVAVAPHTWVTTEQNPANPEDWYGLHHPDGTASASEQAYAVEAARIASGSLNSGSLTLCGAGGPAAPTDPSTASSRPHSGGSPSAPSAPSVWAPAKSTGKHAATSRRPARSRHRRRARRRSAHSRATRRLRCRKASSHRPRSAHCR